MGPGWGSADGRPSQTSTVRWPEVTRARVEASRYRIRHTAERQDTSGITVSYRMTARRTGDEYVISFDEYTVPAAGAADSASRELASFVQRLAAIVRSYRVNRDGEFVRLESRGALRAFMDGLFRSLTAKSGPVPPQVQQLITNLSSDAVLSASAAQEWNAIVGTWIGGQVELGQAYESEGEDPIPVFSGTMMEFDYQFGALRRLSRLPRHASRLRLRRDAVRLPSRQRGDGPVPRAIHEQRDAG